MTKLEEAIEFVKNTGPGHQVLVFYRSGRDVVDLVLGLGEIPYTVLNFDAKPGFVELVVDHFRRGEIAVLLAHRAFLTGVCMGSKVGLEPTVLFTYEAPPEDVFRESAGYSMLRHRNCGGEVVEDPNTEPYEYDANENGNPCKISAYRCRKCSVEILGDSQVILEGYDERDCE